MDKKLRKDEWRDSEISPSDPLSGRQTKMAFNLHSGSLDDYDGDGLMQRCIKHRKWSD